jgi:hypothetical protein
MPKEENSGAQINSLLSDFNTRLRDVEERNRVVKERVLLLGQNLISSREDIEKEIDKIKKDNLFLKKEFEKLKNIVENMLNETDKFARKDEMLLIERMLKDFQPLEFAREKDIAEIVAREISKLGIQKQIKTTKTTE